LTGIKLRALYNNRALCFTVVSATVIAAGAPTRREPMTTGIMQDLEAALLKLHALDGELTTLKRRESAVTTEHRLTELLVMDLMNEAGLTSIRLDNGLGAERRNKIVYNVVPGGWPAIYKRVVERDEWELIQKRISTTAVRERFVAGDRIEGIAEVAVPELKLSGGVPK
jgi:hypothetical protein